ncbi:hypothetical protein [Paenibacillus contaminans]|nr:hypothetical protein [Paenibacillus contaminans]
MNNVISLATAKKNLGLMTSSVSMSINKKGKTTTQMLTEAFKALNKK